MAEDQLRPPAALLRKQNTSALISTERDTDSTERMLLEVQAVSTYFRGWGEENVGQLAETLAVTQFDAGETVLQEGEEGTWLGVLLRGTLDVLVQDKVVHRLKPGEIVGEMILWFGGLRQATVKSHTPGAIATILVGELQELGTWNPPMALGLLKVFGCTSVSTFFNIQTARVQQTLQQALYLPLCSLPKASAAEAKQAWEGLLAVLRESFHISATAGDALTAAFAVHKFEAGQQLVKSGFRLEVMLLVLQGAVAVPLPRQATINAPTFACEHAYFQAESVMEKLEATAAAPGLAAVVPFAAFDQLLVEQPELLFPLLRMLGQQAMTGLGDCVPFRPAIRPCRGPRLDWRCGWRCVVD